jgi:hypothetical protein
MAKALKQSLFGIGKVAPGGPINLGGLNALGINKNLMGSGLIAGGAAAINSGDKANKLWG